LRYDINMSRMNSFHSQLKKREELIKANSNLMKKQVFDAVVHGKGKGGRKIQQALGGTSKQLYPMSMMGDKSKVPRENYGQWGHNQIIRQAIGNPHIPGNSCIS